MFRLYSSVILYTSVVLLATNRVSFLIPCFNNHGIASLIYNTLAWHFFKISQYIMSVSLIFLLKSKGVVYDARLPLLHEIIF